MVTKIIRARLERARLRAGGTKDLVLFAVRGATDLYLKKGFARSQNFGQVSLKKLEDTPLLFSEEKMERGVRES